MCVLGTHWSKKKQSVTPLRFLFSLIHHIINNSESTPLPTCGWCHGANPCPNRDIVFVNDFQCLVLNLYIPAGCGGGGRWEMFMRASECMCICYYFIHCVNVFVRIMSLRTAVFLPQPWSHPVGAQADVSCLFQSSDFLCVCFCVEEENNARLEPAASPVALKFTCFPPICSTEPRQRRHCLLVCR